MGVLWSSLFWFWTMFYQKSMYIIYWYNNPILLQTRLLGGLRNYRNSAIFRNHWWWWIYRLVDWYIKLNEWCDWSFYSIIHWCTVNFLSFSPSEDTTEGIIYDGNYGGKPSKVDSTEDSTVGNNEGLVSRCNNFIILSRALFADCGLFGVNILYLCCRRWTKSSIVCHR